MAIQGSSSFFGMSDTEGYNFQMIVGYCEDLVEWSKYQNCTPKSYVSEYID